MPSGMKYGSDVYKRQTSISMDHAQWLGNTLEEIARKKAGIMKKGIPVVSADQPAGVLEVLQEEAGKRNCPFTRVDMPSVKIAYSSYHIQTFQYKKYKELNIFLPGLYQIPNAALAVEVVEVLRQLGWRITDRQLKEGLMNTRWPGRFTVLSENPVMIMEDVYKRQGQFNNAAVAIALLVFCAISSESGPMLKLRSKLRVSFDRSRA